MTNEQTIGEIMKAAADLAQAEVQHHNMPNSLRAGLCERKRASLRHAITAALAAKDAEIERLTAGQEPAMYVLRSSAKRPQPVVVANQRYLSAAISDLVDMGLDHLDPLYAGRPALAPIAEPAKPEPGEWIEWNGGECPIENGVANQVMFADKVVFTNDTACQWPGWTHFGASWDIVAYRVLL